jgi:hypothetical protein
MRKTYLILAVVAVLLLAGASTARADSTIDYTVTTNIASEGYTFTFAEPGTITSLTTTTAVDLTAGGTNYAFPGATVQFFPLSSDGLFNIDFSYLGHSYEFEFFGAQSYSGSSSPYTLLTGIFPITGGDALLDGSPIAFINNGNVKAVGAPEPATFGLLGLGLAGLGMLRRRLRLA